MKFIRSLFVLSTLLFISGCSTTETHPHIDSDKDGVADYKDICKNTPPLAMVDKYGCALDSDNDGVINIYDKCPNTPFLIQVNSQGCPLKK